MEIAVGELFSGPGGLAKGMELAAGSRYLKDRVTIVHRWINDYDSDACATYGANISINADDIHVGDVRQLDIASLPPINGFAFGFPCNDYSNVGEKKGMNGKFGPLYTYGVAVLKEKQPDWFLAENVGGLESANEGKAFTKILQDLYDSGYDLFPNLYCFENYGVPQARHRIIIVGLRKDLGLTFKIPRHFDKKVTCREALESPPIPKDAPNNELTKQGKTVVERLQYIKPGQNAFNADLPDHLRLNVKGAKISQIYKRLNPDEPAYTVTGSGGGGTHMYHWDEPRALTNRERARIQTFPDDYIFKGSKESVRRQIGMAVPPKGAKIIFESIFKTLLGIEYESESPSMEPMVHERS